MMRRPKPETSGEGPRTLATNPEDPGEQYCSPWNGGILPIPHAVQLARALAKRLAIDKSGTELDLWLLEMARFCEAESGLPQVVEDLGKTLGASDSAKRALRPEAPLPPTVEKQYDHLIHLPLPNGGRLRLDTDCLAEEEVDPVVDLLRLLLRNCKARVLSCGDER